MSDLISRRDVLNELDGCDYELKDWQRWKLKTMVRDIPSAQPDRKKGNWIKISPANIYECSECGKNVMTDDISAYDFCYGCGSEM